MKPPEFSKPGAPPTEFELSLLRDAVSEGDWLQVAQNLMAKLGAQQGASAFLVVLDALGSEKTHVPTRAMLFRSLWLPMRDRQILQLLDAGESMEGVARRFKVSRRRVRQVWKRSGRHCRKKPVSSRT